MLFGRKEKKKSRVAGALKKSIGTNVHRAGWSLIRMPAELLRKRRETGEDPEELKHLSFDELLNRWQIPRDKIPYLKRTLVLEMIAYFLLTCLGLSSVGYKFFNPEYSFAGVLLGLLVSIVALLQLLMRRHWHSILSGQKYRMFLEFLLREEE